ncbi:MAG: hypothetical protein K2H52_14640 [Lachnospiraceae bacterium]|nr:hypothetical protein [Lachnospiraceae bacterium]
MTRKNSYCLMRLLLLFALFVTIPINSYTYVPSYGLFGELKTLIVANENKEEIEEVSSRVTVQKKQKGKNILNLWLLILAYIACLRLLAHSIRLPKTDTIIAKKVRMNN